MEEERYFLHSLNFKTKKLIKIAFVFKETEICKDFCYCRVAEVLVTHMLSK